MSGVVGVSQGNPREKDWKEIWGQILNMRPDPFHNTFGIPVGLNGSALGTTT